MCIAHRAGRGKLNKMKNVNVIRRIDELGRIVLPIDQRKSIDVSPRDYVSLKLENGNIVISKHNKTCIFCGSEDELGDFKGQPICATCRKELAK